MEREGFGFPLDPRLKGVFEGVLVRVRNNASVALIENHLVDESGHPSGKMTTSGLETLAESLKIGVMMALSRARISIPADFVIDEIKLTDTMVESFGKPKVEVGENYLEISFPGENSLIKRVKTPLDPETALRLKPDRKVGNIDLGPTPLIYEANFIPPFLRTYKGLN